MPHNEQNTPLGVHKYTEWCVLSVLHSNLFDLKLYEKNRKNLRFFSFQFKVMTVISGLLNSLGITIGLPKPRFTIISVSPFL